MQSGDVLLEGEFLDALLRFRLERGSQLEVSAVLDFRQQQIGLVGLDGGARLVARFGVAEADGKLIALAHDAGMAHVLVAQHGAQVGAGRVEPLAQRPLHVHLEEEMHAATQVKPQVHGQGVQRGEPGGRTGQQIERHHIGGVLGIWIQRTLDGVLGLELRFGVAETRADAVLVDKDAVVHDARRFQGFLDAAEQFHVDLDGRLDAGDLHRRRFAEEVGQGIQQADGHCCGNEDVFPERVAVHVSLRVGTAAPAGSVSGIKATSACPWAERQ